MHLKKSQILLPRKSCSAPSFYPSSFSFLQRGGRPSSLWEWNERGSWRDKRLGCCHWEIIDPRTLPICTKNALNNRIKKVRHHGWQPKALGQNWPSIFAQRDEKWAFFSSVDGKDAHKEKGKKFQFSERFPMQVFSKRKEEWIMFLSSLPKWH